MRPRAVDHLTRARALRARATPAERRAATFLLTAWLAGGILQAAGWSATPGRWAAERLDGGLPSPAALAARLPPGDPRPAWYAAGLALREERERAASGPARIDPNAADRADWDRLPGIGPRTAEAILATRAERGGFSTPEDLLAVRGIGPVKLERLRPWLRWPDGGAARPAPPGGSRSEAGGRSRVPDLNRVDEAFLTALPKIGPHLAQVILRERSRRGGFRDWAQVSAIEGLGPARTSVLRDATRIPNPRAKSTTSEKENR